MIALFLNYFYIILYLYYYFCSGAIDRRLYSCGSIQGVFAALACAQVPAFTVCVCVCKRVCVCYQNQSLNTGYTNEFLHDGAQTWNPSGNKMEMLSRMCTIATSQCFMTFIALKVHLKL